MAPPVFVVGDVHGHRDVLAALLATPGCSTRRSGGPAPTRSSGSSATSSTAGPTASARSTSSGGSSARATAAVRCLLGNHEAFLLAVHRFGDQETSFPGTTFRDVWR